MGLPRFRLRTLMIAVAVLGVFVATPLNWWNWVRHRANVNPLTFKVQKVFGRETEGFVPFGMEYNLSLSSPKPPFGMFYSIKFDMSVRDEVTGAVIAKYTTYRHLISGVSEESDGFIHWGVRLPKPGRYRFAHQVSYKNPFGTWKFRKSGNTRYSLTTTRANDSPAPSKYR